MQNKGTKPIMKWAGGKTQMLSDLTERMPKSYGKYIEPFFGGGALFFDIQPDNAVIADSNPELINMYTQVANNVENVIRYLSCYRNEKDIFYKVRTLDWTKLSPARAAARTLYLNKTCFNGLYRVNKKGQFNTPFGRYKNPKICDQEHLLKASEILKKATIICGDYLDVLDRYAQKGDFVFLDPPYIPISKNSDFKRYTKEQFYDDDQKRLAKEVKRLYEKGCYVILTNSNHADIYALYSQFKIEVIQTKRSISSKSSSRKGEDVIVTAFPDEDENKKLKSKKEKETDQMRKYPATRFMGSKMKLTDDIWNAVKDFKFQSVIDLFSGSGAVSYMFKSHGKKVISNDYMSMSATFTKAMVENRSVTLSEDDLKFLLEDHHGNDHFVEETFNGLYYSDEDNRTIDRIRNGIKLLDNEYARAIAMTALIRACLKKRPRGIFTYTGNRYNDGRRDLQISFEQQFKEAAEAVNAAVFDNGMQNISFCGDSMNTDFGKADLVYIDPPYFSPHSDNEYVRRYHFVEGLARDWKGVEIQENTKTKKFKSYPTPFSRKESTYEAFNKIFEKYRDSILLVSYSSNSIPTEKEMIEIMKKYKDNVSVIPIDYTYSFGNQKEAKTHRNSVKEFLFIGY